MGVEVNYNYMFCNTSDVHFGPEFSSDDDAEKFIQWCMMKHGDPRRYRPDKLVELKEDWERDCAHTARDACDKRIESLLGAVDATTQEGDKT